MGSASSKAGQVRLSPSTGASATASPAKANARHGVLGASRVAASCYIDDFWRDQCAPSSPSPGALASSSSRLTYNRHLSRSSRSSTSLCADVLDLLRPLRAQATPTFAEPREEIGRGTGGRVYKARYAEGTARAGQVVALKVLFPGLDNDIAAERSMKRLRHPHVCDFLDEFEEGEGDARRVVLVMRYAARGNLKDYITSCGGVAAMPLVDRLSIMLDIIDGLCYLHREGVTHRDLKLQNVLVDVDDREFPVVLLSDFGAARLNTSSTSLVTASMYAGTPSWIAPEAMPPLARFCKRTDVWACGVMLHSLLVGVDGAGAAYSPFYNRATGQADLAVPDFGRVSVGHDDLQARLVDLLSLMLQQEPALRPSSSQLRVIVGKMVEDLRAEVLFCGRLADDDARHAGASASEDVDDDDCGLDALGFATLFVSSSAPRTLSPGAIIRQLWEARAIPETVLPCCTELAALAVQSDPAKNAILTAAGPKVLAHILMQYNKNTAIAAKACEVVANLLTGLGTELNVATAYIPLRAAIVAADGVKAIAGALTSIGAAHDNVAQALALNGLRALQLLAWSDARIIADAAVLGALGATLDLFVRDDLVVTQACRIMALLVSLSISKKERDAPYGVHRVIEALQARISISSPTAACVDAQEEACAVLRLLLQSGSAEQKNTSLICTAPRYCKKLTLSARSLARRESVRVKLESVRQHRVPVVVFSTIVHEISRESGASMSRCVRCQVQHMLMPLRCSREGQPFNCRQVSTDLSGNLEQRIRIENGVLEGDFQFKLTASFFFFFC